MIAIITSVAYDASGNSYIQCRSVRGRTRWPVPAEAHSASTDTHRRAAVHHMERKPGRHVGLLSDMPALHPDGHAFIWTLDL